MVIRLFSLLLLCFISLKSLAQEKFVTQAGKIDFFSETMLENIEANNNKVVVELNTKTGALHFVVPMKAFEFEQSLMKEHFNDDYVESHKFPQAQFIGTITNNSSIAYNKSGSYPAVVKGRLTLHGVTREVESKGIVEVSTQTLRTGAVFYILLSDYGIKLSTLAATMVSNKIKIVVNSTLNPQ